MFKNEVGAEIDVTRIEHEEQRIAKMYVQQNDVVLELGARYGTVSAKIQAQLANKKMHVAVEPDSRVIETLRANLERHASEAVVFHGIVSKTPGVLEGDGYGTIVRLNGNGTCCASTTVEELEKQLGANFTVLIADCEGCLGPFLKDFPQLLEQLRLVHFETDPGYHQTDYEQIKLLLREHGFREAEHVNWQWVFVKDVRRDE
jgi:FkbM family methyltransferase